MKKTFQLFVVLLPFLLGAGIAYSQSPVPDFARLSLAVKHNPSSAAVWYNRGTAYYKTAKYDLAVADLTQCLAIAAGNIKALQARGNSYWKLAKVDSAIADYSAILKDSTDDREVYILRGDAYQQQGRYRACISDYSDAIDLDTTKDILYNSRGISYYRLGIYDSAATDFIKALSLKPTVTAYTIRAILALSAKGEYAKAADYYTKYKQKKLTSYIETPDNLFLKAYITACTGYLNSNDHNNALPALLQAANAYKPVIGDQAGSAEYSNILAKIASLYEQADNLDTALQYYANAKLAAPDCEFVAVKLGRLQQTINNNKAPAIIILDSPAHTNTSRGQYIEAELTDENKIYVKGSARSQVGINQVKINGITIEIDSAANFETYISDTVRTLHIQASTKKNVTSDTAFQLLAKRNKKTPVNIDIPIIGVNEHFHAIFIANSAYTGVGNWQAIPSTLSEADKLKQLLIDNYNFEPENVVTLYNKSKSEIIKGLRDKLRSLGENDDAIIFYGGHGYLDQQSNEAYWVPVNTSDPADYISNLEITAELKNLQAKHILILADACFSGAFRGAADEYVPFTDDYKMRSRQMLTSGSIETVPGVSIYVPNIIQSLKTNDNKYFAVSELYFQVGRAIKNESGRLARLIELQNIPNSGIGQFYFKRKIIDSTTVKDPAELERIKQKEMDQKLEFANKKRAFDSLILSGRSFKDKDMLGDALREFKAAVAINPEPLNTYAQNLLDEVSKTYGLTPELRLAAYVDSAKVYKHKRLYEEARNWYIKAINFKPDAAASLNGERNALSEKSANINRLDGYVKLGSYKEAVGEYSKIIKPKKNDPESSDFYLGRALCYDKLGRYDDALSDLNKAIILDPTYLEAIKARAELQRNNNKKREAISDYQTAVGLEKDPLVYMELYKLHADNTINLTDEAIKDLNFAINLNPLYKDAYYYRGLLYFDRENYQKAFDDFNTAVQQDTVSAVNYFQRGSAYLKLNRMQEASEDYKTARRKNLDSIHIKGIRDYAANIYDTTKRAAGNKLYDSALFYINRAILIDPLSALYRKEKGNYYYELNTYAQAIKNYDSAIDLYADYHEALYKRGMAYYHLSKYETSIEDFEKVLALDVTDVDAMKAEGDARFQLADYKSAIPVYEKTLQTIDDKKGVQISDSVKSRINNNLGYSYYKNGSFDQSIKSLSRAVRLDENNAFAYYNLGISYQQINELKNAAENIDKALTLYDNYMWNYSDAEIYRQRNNYDRAVTLYSKAITNDPQKTLTAAYYYRGYCYSQLNGIDSAIKDYQTAISYNIDTAFPDFNNQLGALYLHSTLSQANDSAFAYYSKSFARDGSDANAAALYGMASALYLQKRVDEAYPLFERAFKTLAIPKGVIKDDRNYDTFKADKKFKALFNKYY